MNGTMQEPVILPVVSAGDSVEPADLVFDHGIPGFAGARRFSLSSWGADDGPFSLIKSLDDLRNPPSNRLHELKRDRKGQHSISINDQWRICFRFKDGNAYDVEIADYH